MTWFEHTVFVLNTALFLRVVDMVLYSLTTHTQPNVKACHHKGVPYMVTRPLSFTRRTPRPNARMSGYDQGNKFICATASSHFGSGRRRWCLRAAVRERDDRPRCRGASARGSGAVRRD